MVHNRNIISNVQHRFMCFIPHQLTGVDLHDGVVGRGACLASKRAMYWMATQRTRTRGKKKQTKAKENKRKQISE